MEDPEFFHADPALGLSSEQARERAEAGLAAGVQSPVGKTGAQIVLTHISPSSI